MPVGVFDTEPDTSWPQAAIEPSVRRAYPCESPAAIAVNPVPPGVFETCPWLSHPQAAIEPSARSAYPW